MPLKYATCSAIVASAVDESRSDQSMPVQPSAKD